MTFLVKKILGNLSFLMQIQGYDFPSFSRILYLGLNFLIKLFSRRRASDSVSTSIIEISFMFVTKDLVFSSDFFPVKYDLTLFLKFLAFPT